MNNIQSSLIAPYNFHIFGISKFLDKLADLLYHGSSKERVGTYETSKADDWEND